MATGVYDYTFRCDTLEGLLHGPAGAPGRVVVTHWSGVEAVSRPYRFEITFAVGHAALPLEKLLDRAATLTAKMPGGGARQWHGIVTRAGEAGSDETHRYYQVVLEPRLVRLRNMQWSDIYLKRDLADLIKQLLDNAGLTDTYGGDGAPYDYRISATQLSRTRTDFTCQFEESCLDFLMRRLEYYGVYFWFEQGKDRESVVFANDVTQQPATPDIAIHYPRGILDPDARHIAIRRLNRQVGLPPRAVVLHGHQDHDNTTLTLLSRANVPLPPNERGLGEIHSVDDHFEQVEGDGSISGTTLARWRAQEQACGRIRAEGEAATPGLRAGWYLQVSEYHRGNETHDYYVTEVTHEGSQAVETAPRGKGPAYRAEFVALPRWLDPAKPSEPLQFRPPRRTPVPEVTRLLNGFVDISDPRQPKRYAQPDEHGRYKVRFLFARQRYDGDQNSAFVRMATPYAGGAATQGLSNAGMHFPLREGTEVLLAFLRGDPDRPVIVAALPNVEAPSPVNVDNAGQHVIATPAGNSVVLADTRTGGTADQPSVNLYSPVANTSLNLGTSNTAGVADGFSLRTDGNGDIHAGTSMLIEVPGHYRVSAGGTNAELSNFLSSTKSFAPGISGSTTGGIVMTNFVGAKLDSVGGMAISNFLGIKSDTKEGAFFDFTLGFKLVVDWSKTWKFAPFEKKTVVTDLNETYVTVTRTAGTVTNNVATQNDNLGTGSVVAAASYSLASPNIAFSAAGAAAVSMSAAGLNVMATAINTDATAATSIKSAVSTTLEAGASSMALTPASAKIDAPVVGIETVGDIDLLSTAGSVFIVGPLIQIG
ncbi:type VI secretion system Vgr family protein [Bordetella bronchialis]|uniref:Gp5/Type VI secretion system Vgr protein OB-fold domain-containing protein n=1 Tax=Bordetella bronchialis TaxID=463025 RepID=A0A193FL91_9BORD|nr:type VI secretion system Vgr family protein [Bordetella bronchialis]ANN68532.1 hypothetical protein BAU06_21470 [Bordetella bronchialis]ANN73673.1 hypothetical protein BAU08_22005 [Bordetella bronchialis]